MAKTLALITQGIKGGNCKWTPRLGFVKAYISDPNREAYEENYINIDNYQGHGTAYRQRDTPLITVRYKNEEIFCGDFDTLVAILKTARQSKD